MTKHDEGMSGKKLLITIIDPPGEFFTGSKQSLARYLATPGHPLLPPSPPPLEERKELHFLTGS
jgi:hypothetical protein